MINKTITIIGAGNMGPAIARGLVQNKVIEPMQITLCDPREERLEELSRELGDIEMSIDNTLGAEGVDIIVLAIKPHLMKAVCEEIADVLEKQLIVSVAAGIHIDSIRKWIKKRQQPVVRVMPNTPAQIGVGMSGWTATKEVSQRQRQTVKQILQALGEEIYFDDEEEIDLVTALSGSGPAYFFYFIELLQRAGEKTGLPKRSAEQLAMQTAFGAIELLRTRVKTNVGAQDLVPALRKEVTSPGGTTEAAIKILEKEGLEEIFEKALRAAVKRAQQLSRENF